MVRTRFSMKTISSEQKDLIDALIAEGLAGNLSAAVLEKDVHVTDALRALATLPKAGIAPDLRRDCG